MDNNGLYNLFFSQISNITNHYQYLIILIIGANSYIYLNSTNRSARIL